MPNIKKQVQPLSENSRAAAVAIEKAGFKRTGSCSYLVWICKGKYYGHRMASLPVSYLSWVINTFDEGSLGFLYAAHEIEKRLK